MKRHRIDPISLVTGALFTGLGVAWFAGVVGFQRDDHPWIWAAGLVALGLAVLAASIPSRQPHAHETSDRLTSENPRQEESPEGDA
jgi:hypothetical protein